MRTVDLLLTSFLGFCFVNLTSEDPPMRHLLCLRERLWNSHPVSWGVLAGSLAILLFGSGTPVHAGSIIITPTFDSSITGNVHAAAIVGDINSAITYYESTFTTNTATPVNVAIDFQNMSTGLGQSSTVLYQVNYSALINALAAASSGDATDTAALAHLPTGSTNPVTGGTTMFIKSANGRALGFNTPGAVSGTYDGVIGLNTSLTDVNGGPYSLLAVIEHEMDEVLGLGSDVGSFATPAPEDSFRYDASGNRSFTTNTSAQAFFSLDGTTDLAQFDNQGDGGDYGDWQSNPLPFGVAPRVQDAFATPGATPTLANDGGAEVVALDAIGYNLSGQGTTPEPATLTLLAIGLGSMSVYSWRRRRPVAAVAR
jgi:PEP-CTERM motif